jgi:orotate phosphoribosyltransferase
LQNSLGGGKSWWKEKDRDFKTKGYDYLLTEEKILDILKKAGVLLKGHFLLTSGKHSDTYLQCAKIFQDAKYSEQLCRELAQKFKDDKVDVVVGPAIGAIIMSYEVGRQLGVRNFFTERDSEGKMTLRRNFEIKKGERVLVVEDVVTTGGSVKEVLQLLESSGADIVGVGSIVDRTGGKIDFGYPYKSVLSVNVLAYEAEECPFCKKNISIIKPGSRK